MKRKYKHSIEFVQLLFYLETGLESGSELELVRGFSGSFSLDFDFSFTISLSDLGGDLSKLELEDFLLLETDLDVDLLLLLDVLDF